MLISPRAKRRTSIPCWRQIPLFLTEVPEYSQAQKVIETVLLTHNFKSSQLNFLGCRALGIRNRKNVIFHKYAKHAV